MHTKWSKKASFTFSISWFLYIRNVGDSGKSVTVLRKFVNLIILHS